MHVSTKFEVNRSKNMATGAKKPPKKTLWRHNVATLLRHDVNFYMEQSAYAICMFPPNLKQIGRKTWLQGPKNRQKRRYDVITSRRCYVMTFFFTWYNAPMPYTCFHQIWSKSVKKCAHSGQNKFSWRHDVMTSWRRENFRPPITPAQVISMMCPSLKKIGWETSENISL